MTTTRTPAALLARAEELVTTRRHIEVEQLENLLAWADTFSGDPQDEPDAVPVRHGGPKLITLGGDGTPGVNDLALVEMAIARHESVHTTRRALADAFDLRHRLPNTWAGTQALHCETWVARKVASLSRKLTRDQAVIVDEAVAAALDEAPGRIITIAEAKVIEADTVAHAERLEANQRRRGVWYPKPRPGSQISDVNNTAGIGTVIARLDETQALAHEQLVGDLAAALAHHTDTDHAHELGPDHWRAEAFAMLADPAAVLAFLQHDQGSRDPRCATTTTTSTTRPAEVVVHVALTEQDGELAPVARVEGLGPRLLDQVRELLANHQTITITPVIDLNTGRSVNGYEHPTDVRRRSELRMHGDVFPHAATLFTTAGRTPDHDHTVPYRHGPPGQTGDHNDTPLTRHSHRAKTHLGYTVFQLGPNEWIWGTPHGRYRHVTGGGTRPITITDYALLTQTIAVDLAA